MAAPKVPPYPSVRLYKLMVWLQVLTADTNPIRSSEKKQLL